MSLALRKAAQPQLDTHNLQNFHVRINDNKNLNVVGECGKPLFSIKGIQFGSYKPTCSEIEYAVELLGTFLLAHSEKIQKFIEANAEFKSLPVIEQTVNEFSVLFSGDSSKCSWTKDGIKTIIDMDGEMLATTGYNASVPATVMQAYKVTAATKREAIAHLNAYVEYVQSQNALNKLRSALSSCDI